MNISATILRQFKGRQRRRIERSGMLPVNAQGERRVPTSNGSLSYGRVIAMLMVLNTSLAPATVRLLGPPTGKMTEAPEITAMFSGQNMGEIFTVAQPPMPDSSGKHTFNIPHTQTYCQFVYADKDVRLKRGEPFGVTDVKQIHKVHEGKEVVVAMAELKRLSNGKPSTEKKDRIVFKCTFDVTGSRVFEEEHFVRALMQYFDSVVYETRHGRQFALPDSTR